MTEVILFAPLQSICS